ncbi:MAG: hypothetical protein K940chlam7_00212 [Chlamydiae bacterium]|nr:hypothetical protein [Chlamydiota bacterium]
MNTLNLTPGYVTQGFSVARAELFHAAEWANEKHHVAGYIAGVTAKLLSKGTEYLELPVRIIEDVALTIINLVGATFKEGCRKNLGHCFRCLGKDFYDSLITAPIVCIHWLTAAVAGYHIVNAIYDFNPKLQQTEDYHRVDFYRVQVMRKHGHEALKSLDDLLPSKLRDKDPSILLNLYKQTLQFDSEKLKIFIDGMKEEQKSHKAEVPEGSTEVNNGWDCPEELKRDNSDMGKVTKRILGLSYNIDLSKLTKLKLKIKGLLCNMLNIHYTSGDDKIRKQKNALIVLLHPDKSENNENYRKAFEVLLETHRAYVNA